MNGKMISPRAYFAGTAEMAIQMLGRMPDELRLDAITRLLPNGWAISGPEREAAIKRMEIIVDVYLSRPTQYSRNAHRPED